MVGTTIKVSPKVQASTIPEVIVAMVIIMVIFGIAMMIFANVTRSSLSVRKIKAEAVLQEILLNSASQPDITSKTFTSEDLIIEQLIKPINNEPKLSVISITAFDANHQKIASVNQIIINNPYHAQ